MAMRGSVTLWAPCEAAVASLQILGIDRLKQPWGGSSKVGLESVQLVKYYAVQRGYTLMVYLSWSDCEREVKEYKKADFKLFRTKAATKDFVWELLDWVCSDQAQTLFFLAI